VTPCSVVVSYNVTTGSNKTRHLAFNLHCPDNLKSRTVECKATSEHILCSSKIHSWVPFNQWTHFLLLQN